MRRRGCQCTSVVAVVTTMCFPAELVVPGGGAGPRRDREQLFLTASSQTSAVCCGAIPSGQTVKGG